jgi:hypothetical protein
MSVVNDILLIEEQHNSPGGAHCNPTIQPNDIRPKTKKLMGSVPFMKDYLQCQNISINIAYVTGHNLVEERFQKTRQHIHGLPYFQRGSTAMLLFSS